VARRSTLLVPLQDAFLFKLSEYLRRTLAAPAEPVKQVRV
jgi:hypothetical protein